MQKKSPSFLAHEIREDARLNPSHATDPKKPVVLVVDDSLDHQWLVKRAAKKLDLPIEFKSFYDGEEAISYILGKGSYTDRKEHPLPALMLLDLKMSRVSGFEVLSRLSQERAKKPPYICVMSSSDLKEDVDKSLKLGADVYHTKPSDFDKLCDLLLQLALFFCMNNKLTTSTSAS